MNTELLNLIKFNIRVMSVKQFTKLIFFPNAMISRSFSHAPNIIEIFQRIS